MSNQIFFLEGTYTLLHIPLDLYGFFMQPILRVLIPQTQSLDAGSQLRVGKDLEGLSSKNQHHFFNVSVTPLECSVVCHSWWAKKVFEPVIKTLSPHQAKAVSGRPESYMALSIISANLDAASRVLELTSPLALAGIPIFFITTYYSDFILVPAKERQNVIDALLHRGFELADNKTSFISFHQMPESEPSVRYNEELQLRTFRLLQNRDVTPYIEPGLRLIHCSCRDVPSPPTIDEFGHVHGVPAIRHDCTPAETRASWIENVNTKFYTALVSVLLSRPRFLSVTLAHDDPPSVLLDKTLLPMFGDSIIGDADSILIPIFLDLVSLPSQVTGVVCGVSGRLVRDMKMTMTSELSYVSTARSGVVILPEERSRRALEILNPLLDQE
ncbi:hypothetical protein E4U41_006974 [Claviceps citrina]|nr:hypothetical protein E4U41_006974 [Claviceps citrina]